MNTPIPLTGLLLTGLVQFPVNRTVRLTGTEYTKFDIRTTRSPDNGSPVNEFRREVPVNQTVLLLGTECIMFC